MRSVLALLRASPPPPARHHAHCRTGKPGPLPGASCSHLFPTSSPYRPSPSRRRPPSAAKPRVSRRRARGFGLELLLGQRRMDPVADVCVGQRSGYGAAFVAKACGAGPAAKRTEAGRTWPLYAYGFVSGIRLRVRHNLWSVVRFRLSCVRRKYRRICRRRRSIRCRPCGVTAVFFTGGSLCAVASQDRA